MLIEKIWYTLDEAVAKYGLQKEEILEWVDEGVVRSESGEGGVLVQGDDLELKIAERSETL